MNQSLYLRPLRQEDALVSWQWRNNPKLWKWTGARPDRYITPEIESAWLEEVLKRDNEKRFAICTHDGDRYIGNIYLTHIHGGEAQVHIFIGDMEYWGGGRAHEAVCLLFDYAFESLQLRNVLSTIVKENSASIALSRRLGFRDAGEDGQYIRQVFSREMYDRGEHLEWNKKNQYQFQ